MLPSAFARFLIYLCLLPLAGTCVYSWRWTRASERAHLLALVASLGLVVALLFRAWAYTYAAFGLEDALRWESFRIIVLESRWGGRWQYQFVAAALAVVACVSMYLYRTLGWTLASIAVLASCAALPLTGHAVSSNWTLLTQAAHVVGASVWLGTLFVLTLLREQDLTLREFAPVAFSGAALVVVSGVLTAIFYSPSISALWESAYGQVLSAKVALVVAVLLCGFANYRRFRRSTGRSWVRVELAVAVLVLALTGWLTGIDPP